MKAHRSICGTRDLFNAVSQKPFQSEGNQCMESKTYLKNLYLEVLALNDLPKIEETEPSGAVSEIV